MLILDVFHQLPNRGFSLTKNISGTGAFALTFVKDDYKIRILDSTNFFKTSLGELGHNLKLEKKDVSDVLDENGIPYDVFTAPDDLLQEYCQRDSDILELAVTTLLDFIKREQLGKMAITIAGQSFNAYRARFYPKKEGIWIHNNTDVIKLEQESYKGGRNECFYIGERKLPTFILDINSMYPSVMQRFEYPTKLVGYLLNPTIKELEDLYFTKNELLYVAECLIDTDEPVYGVKSERLTFPVGKFKTVLTTPEILYAWKHGHLKEIYSFAIYEKAYIFKDYIDYMWSQRNYAKHTENDSDALLYKYFMNTLYGKFAQLERETDIIDSCDVNEVGSDSFFDHETQKNITIRMIGGKVFMESRTEDPTFNAFPAIASHVTAYARMYIWELIQKCGINNVFYVDTDSIFTNEEGALRLSDYIDEYDLGLLKVEYMTKHANFRGLKDYAVTKMNSKEREEYIKVIENKITSDKMLKNITEYKIKEDYLHTDKIKGISKFMTKDPENDNKFTGFRFEKLISAMKNDRIDRVTEIPLIKELNREYKKGTVLDDGRVTPFVLDDNTQLVNPRIVFEETMELPI